MPNYNGSYSAGTFMLSEDHCTISSFPSSYSSDSSSDIALISPLNRSRIQTGSQRNVARCCSTGTDWTTNFTQNLLSKFTHNLESPLARSWPHVCVIAMRLLRFAENRVDNVHLRHQIRDFAEVMHLRIFWEYDRIDESCPNFYWKRKSCRPPERDSQFSADFRRATSTKPRCIVSGRRLCPRAGRAASNASEPERRTETVTPLAVPLCANSHSGTCPCRGTQGNHGVQSGTETQLLERLDLKARPGSLPPSSQNRLRRTSWRQQNKTFRVPRRARTRGRVKKNKYRYDATELGHWLP